MAIAQIKSALDSTILLKRPQYLVEFKPAWGSAWRTYDYVRLESCSQAVSPSLPRVLLTWLAGNIKHEDVDDFYPEQPTDLKDWFVRVSVLPAANTDPALPQQSTDPQRLGIYVIPEESLRFGGDTNAALGDQSLVGYGLEYLLDRRSIATAWVTNDGSTAKEIAIVPTLNEKFERGNYEVGNRSDSAITTDINAGKKYRDGNPLPAKNVTACVFSDDGKPWTVRNFIEYLLAFHGDGEVDFTLGGQLDALEYVLPRFDFAGLTVYETLNRLIDRRRGLGWCVRTSENPIGEDNQPAAPANRRVNVEIHVFTGVGTPIAVGDLKLPANPEKVSFDLSSFGGNHPTDLSLDHRIADVVLTVDNQSRYGKIIVSGEPVLVMFTVSIRDETLTPLWTDAQAAAYKAGSGDGSDAEKNDAERATDKFAHVYTTFVLPRTWNWKAGGGAGTPPDKKQIVNIGTDNNAHITRALDLVPMPYRNWGHRLAEKLPLPKESTDPALDGQREYRDPFVLLRKNDGSWVYADRAGEDNSHQSMHLRMLDKIMGFELRGRPNHVLALNHFTDAKATKFTPEVATAFDFGYLMATVAVRTDARAQVIVDLPYQTWSGEEADVAAAKAKRLQSRVLQVNVPGAELWYCVENTVIDVKDGQPQRRVGKFELDGNKFDSLLLRDDGDRLRAVAALAKAWYGQPRSAVTLTINDIELAYPVGAFAEAAQDLWRYEPINAPVTEKIYSFGPDLRTEIRTNFAELDPTIIDRESRAVARREERLIFRNPRV